ncbi:MAG: hypothetical protein HYU59_08775 [Magnetospirillum gryphiswaldense]|nr:hypothetical protein [Magnetospirillum gryphiswaldense]
MAMQYATLLAAPLFLLALVGLGSWRVPPGALGLRATIGVAIFSLVVLFAHVVAGLPLAGVAWVLAFVGWAGVVWRWPSWDAVLHPLAILMVGYLVMGGGQDGIVYVPWGDDEFINWLRSAKQIFLARWDFSPQIAFALPSYPQGWPTLLALPSILVGRNFSEDLASVVPFVLHVVFLGLLFDFALVISKRLYAWALVLSFLTVEVTWKLLPLNLMSEQPQIYAVATVFVLCLWAEMTAPSQRRTLLAAAGLMAAHAYLIKTAALLLLPALLVVVAWPLFFGERQRLSRMGDVTKEMLVAVGPFVAVWLVWSSIASDGGHCATSLGNYFSLSGIGRLMSDMPAALAYMQASASYYSSYKLPLSLLAMAGLGYGLVRPLTRKVVVAVLAYAVLYHCALFWSYRSCPDSFNFFLSSLQRYILVPLRVLHVVGVVLLFHAVLGRLLPSRPWMDKAAAVLIVLLAAGQMFFLHRGLIEVRQRDNGREFAVLGQTVKGSAETLKRVLDAWDRRPQLLQLASFPYAYALYPTYHYMMNDDGRTLPFSYCLATGEMETVRFDALEAGGCLDAPLDQQLAKADIIWPLSLTPFMNEALRRHVGPGCPADLTGRILVRRGAIFTCDTP